ncbi:TPA: glycosyl transferase, partial [Proteus mirabilis]|nr:glycosyl transferase [Proteus mirabilis]
LRQQALREFGSFFILFRKRCDTKNQTIIAQQFRTYHLFPALNKGAQNWRQRWFICRVYCVLYWHRWKKR